MFLEINFWLAVFCVVLISGVPFGLLLTKIFGLGDIRKIGSGNIGATNVLRTGNKSIAVATMLLDMLKGVFVIVLAKQYDLQNLMPIELWGLLSVLGHIFSIFLKGRGGKGVATMLGVLIALDFRIAIATLFAWGIAVKLSKTSSVGALSAAVSLPLITLLFVVFDVSNLQPQLICLFTFVIALSHHENIKHLLNGAEKSFK